MNLLELSQKTGLSPENLRALLYNRYHRIVLHNLAPVNAEVEAELLAEYAHPTQPVTHPAKKQALRSPDHKRQQTETLQLLHRCDAQGYRAFIDTCSLLHPGFSAFYQLYRNTATHPLYVPYVVRLELEKKLHDPRLHAQASRVLELINHDERITVVGDANDLRRTDRGEKRVHADTIFVEKSLFFHNNGRSILLLTQDKSLTADLLKINTLQSRSTKAVVLVKKLTPAGTLADSM